jgi:hypothetical protein
MPPMKSGGSESSRAPRLCTWNCRPTAVRFSVSSDERSVRLGGFEQSLNARAAGAQLNTLRGVSPSQYRTRFRVFHMPAMVRYTIAIAQKPSRRIAFARRRWTLVQRRHRWRTAGISELPAGYVESFFERAGSAATCSAIRIGILRLLALLQPLSPAQVMNRDGRIVCSIAVGRPWHPLAEPGRRRKTRSSRR